MNFSIPNIYTTHLPTDEQTIKIVVIVVGNTHLKYKRSTQDLCRYSYLFSLYLTVITNLYFYICNQNQRYSFTSN